VKKEDLRQAALSERSPRAAPEGEERRTSQERGKGTSFFEGVMDSRLKEKGREKALNPGSDKTFTLRRRKKDPSLGEKRKRGSS